MSQPDVDAMAAEVVLLLKSALAPLQARLLVLETQQAVPVPPVADIAPEDMAASIAGLLRKELADLDRPARTSKRIVRDGQGAVKYEIEETH